MTPTWRCSGCGSPKIECCFPIWICLNDDTVDTGEIDFEASPEKDSRSCFCPECEGTVTAIKYDGPLKEEDVRSLEGLVLERVTFGDGEIRLMFGDSGQEEMLVLPWKGEA